MKFFVALWLYLLLAAFLAWGISLLVRGNPWVLIISFVLYLAGLVLFGCFPPKEKHL